MPCQFCHLLAESRYRDRLPPIFIDSNSVKRQYVPASGTYPSADILLRCNLPTVHIELVQRRTLADRVVGSSWAVARWRSPKTSPGLLISRVFHCLREVSVTMVERVAE